MKTLSDHLKTKETINSKTGKLQSLYYYKGKLCPTHLIAGPLSKQYIGYSLILKDLEDAESWLQQAYDLFPKKETGHAQKKDNIIIGYIGDEKNHRIVKSLFFSSLIFYGKCFTQAKGRGVKLEKKTIMPAEYHEKHDRIMNYRHNLAAHSGEGDWDTGRLRLVLPPTKGSGIVPSINPEMHRLDFEDDRMEDFQFLELLKITHKNVRDKKEKIAQKIFKDLVYLKGEDYWYQSAPQKTTKRRKR